MTARVVPRSAWCRRISASTSRPVSRPGSTRCPPRCRSTAWRRPRSPEVTYTRGVVAALAGMLLGLAAACPAHAGGAVERIRAEGVLRCGAVERMGIADAPPEGPAAGGVVGIAVDVCRALAVAVLGPGGRVAFSLYDAPHSFDALRGGADELGLLTGSEIAEQNLGAGVVPGPTIASSPVAVMVPDASPVHRLADLSGQTVCVMIGSAPQ